MNRMSNNSIRVSLRMPLGNMLVELGISFNDHLEIRIAEEISVASRSLPKNEKD